MRAAYDAEGFTLVRNFFSRDAVQPVLEDADRLLGRSEIVTENNLRCRWQAHIETGQAILDTLDPVVDLSPAVRAIAESPALLSLLEELLGEPVALFKDKLIYKPPGAIGHPWHQDYISWPSFPTSFTTVLVALDASTPENGSLEVFAGHHHKGYLSPRDGEFHDLPAGRFDARSRVRLDLSPGDVAVFGCYLPHGSGPNRSRGFRRHLYLSYNRRGDGGNRREAHYAEFRRWLRDRYNAYGAGDFYFK